MSGSSFYVPRHM